MHRNTARPARFRATDTTRDGAPYRSTIEAEMWDGMLSRAVNAPAARFHLAVAVDEESIVMRTPLGQEWMIDRAELRRAIRACGFDVPEPDDGSLDDEDDVDTPRDHAA